MRSGGTSDDGHREQPSAVREFPLDPGGTVEIVLAASDLRVRGIDGDRVIVRTRDGGPLDDKVRIEAAPGSSASATGRASVRLGPLRCIPAAPPTSTSTCPGPRRSRCAP